MRTFRFCFSNALALALIALLTACGDKPAATSTAGTPAAPATGAITPATAAAPVAAVTPAELMRRANAAFRDGRIAAPANDNAVELFLAVRERDARYPGLAEALVELMPLANMAFESAMRARDLPEAERMLGLMSRLNAESQTTKIANNNLAGLRTQIAKQEAAQTAAEAGKLVAAAPVTTPEPNKPVSVPVVAAPQPTMTKAVAASSAASELSESAVSEPAVPVPAMVPAVVANTSSNLTPAVAISKVAPDYPAQARRRKVEGFVELEFLVNTSGGADDIRVVRSEPEGLFDRSAVRALMRWKFKPAQRNGVPEVAKTRTMLNFRQG